MNLICSPVALTWYPGAPGDTASPLVLLSSSQMLPASSNLVSEVEQMVQPRDFVRGDSMDFYPRGNLTTRLSWEEVRDQVNPSIALETALALQAGLPRLRGWMSINIDGRDTSWKVVPAVVRGARHRHDPMTRKLHLTWTVECGQLSILVEGEEPPPIYAPGELVEGPAVNRGAILLGPNRTYPES
jgi:hypothetical protein